MPQGTMPIPVAGARRLATPRVVTEQVTQTVDLNPSGNTVALTTVADNPFAREGNGISVVTQASGGMSPAPQSMQSRRLYHGFMPGMAGLGEEEAPKQQQFSSVLDTVTSAGSDVLSTLSERERRKAAEAAAKSQAATARAREIEAEAGRVRAETQSYLSRLGQNKGSRTLFIVAGLALLGAVGVYAYQKKTGKKITVGRKR